MKSAIAAVLLLLLLCQVCLAVVEPVASSDSPLTTSNKAKKTAFPTKRKPTSKPTASLKPTSKPTVDLLSRDDELLSTRVPSAMLTTLFPTQNPATKQPTSVLGESQCSKIKYLDQCSQRGNECEWYAMQTCNYNNKPVTCQTYEYGCQERRQFCEFTKGSQLDRQMQCNSKGFPCQWDNTQMTCGLSTRAPSPPPFVRSYCDNTCSKANNNKCNDGGSGSVNSACTFGTDCDDCGPRLV
ncbi:hypothetical protein BASA81_004969 [Batrachochytrium salamandrivorans]|nr:hypothetical protein BASA81_004969 [Batrachochytrium salamandrivorans]